MGTRGRTMVTSLVPKLRLEMTATRSDTATLAWLAESPPTTTSLIVSRRRHHMPDTTVQRTSELLYLDDLHVGRRFTSGTHALDERQITAFASEFDPQPFHMDREAAKATLFGGLAASGWHTAAITMKLLVASGLPLMGGIIGSGGEVSWPRPTRPGDTLTVVSEIDEITPSHSRPDRGMIRV